MYCLRSSKRAPIIYSLPNKKTPISRTRTRTNPQKKKKPPPSPSPSPPPPPPPISLVSLIDSYIKVGKSLKPILKPLYSLICSSFSYEVIEGNHDNDAVKNVSNLTFDDTVTLSGILFKELREKLMCSSGDASVVGNVRLRKFDVKNSGEELLLLVRCCVLLVRLHPYDQVLTEQFQVVVALLRKLSFHGIPLGKVRESIQYTKLLPSHSTFRGCKNSSSLDINAKSVDFNAKSPEPYLSFIQQMQEVYLDELFADRSFLKCMAISDSVSSTCQNVSVQCSMPIESVLEIIAAHFLLSISGKDALHTITERLYWTEKHVLSSPKVSFLVASSLVNHPVMKSAPTLLFSHVISLLSDVISIHVFPEKVGQRTQEYLSAFHDSVILYREFLSMLMPDYCSPERIVRKPFEFYFHFEIYDRINVVLLDLDNAWRVQTRTMFDKTKSSMAIDAISYIKTNICIVDESYRKETLSFLSSLITKVVSVEMNEVHLQRFKEMFVQDFCLLASILKLMSCSLLQATRSDKQGCFKSLLKRNAFPMIFFSQYNFHVSIEVRQFIVDALKPHHSTCKEYELMFVHFAGLLSLCIVSGLRILMNGCLFIMLVLMNALALELGSLEFLGLLVNSGAELHTLFSPATVNSFVTTDSDSGSFAISPKFLKVASRFQKERRLLFRDQTASENPVISGDETCNGEIYLKCLIKNKKDIDELADFVECKPWRDYSARLSCIENIRIRRIPKSNRRLQQAKIQVRSSERIENKRKRSF